MTSVHDYPYDISLPDGPKSPLFSDWILLPEQLDDGYEIRAQTRPEEKLLFAVFLGALADLSRGSNVAANLAWLERHDPASMYSFVSICGHFGINPERLRVVLKVAVEEEDQEMLDRLYDLAERFYRRIRV